VPFWFTIAVMGMLARRSQIESFSEQRTGKSILAALSVLVAFSTLVDAAPPGTPGAKIYVSIPAWNQVDEFNPSGSGSIFANAGPSEPFGLAVDNHGNLYTSSLFGNTIEKYTPDGMGTAFVSLPFLWESVGGLAFDSSGNLYIACAQRPRPLAITPNLSNYGAILKVNQSGSISVFANVGSGRPLGLACDTNGNIYAVISDQIAEDNVIAKYAPDGTGSLITSMDSSLLWGAAVGPDGNLYVTDALNDSIIRFTQDGNRTTFADTGLSGPRGLAFDSDGSLYVLTDGTIQKFTVEGERSIYATDLYLPEFIAIRPKPGHGNTGIPKK
jgi:sugar lactone lactonase YvrE